jgi:hypothetical protein
MKGTIDLREADCRALRADWGNIYKAYGHRP